MGNRLAYETSPYLLQHANNPVEWFPWGEEALEKAKSENKILLVSIGYSACHWCHVMEHESFEDGQVAEIMNRHFVCIKIDREERPDIDQIYMNAVQLIAERGGWPLNCFCLPDQRPIYGGTYFKKEDWCNVLLSIANFWNEKPQEAIAYAEKLTEGIRQSEKLVSRGEQTEFSKRDLEVIMHSWSRTFDMSEGGYNRSPKFPLPNNWQFMIRYAHLMQDDSAHVISRLTLQKMAFGGIYDQIGGGFARYSVDERWHVPHFEKMLYDNAQLISLYAEAHQYSPDLIYKNVVFESIDFVKRELSSTEGGFYAALDADSEGVEGKFYTFTKDEIGLILGDDAEIFCIYYNVTDDGNWEEEQTNIFLRKLEDAELAKKLGMSVKDLTDKISVSREKIFRERSRRIRPGLDNKILASWNGMMLKALTDAYRVFDEKQFLEMALQNANFIIQNLSDNNRLKRVFDNRNPDISKKENAFLDDYAFVIQGFIGLYEVTFDEKWLNHALSFLDYCIANFYDQESGMFYYTSATGEQLIARKQEIMDNVIPASNSVMANNLFILGHFYDNKTYLDKTVQMLRTVKPYIESYPSGYSNWATLLMYDIFGIYEIAITGADAELKRKEFEKHYVPNKIILGGLSGTLPLLDDKWGSETRIFVCKNRTCRLPVTTIEEAVKQILS